MEESGLWREPEVGKGAGMAIADAPAELVRQRTTVMAFDAGVEEELCTRSKSCLRTAAELMTPARRPRRIIIVYLLFVRLKIITQHRTLQ